jgi:hypothetical protein
MGKLKITAIRINEDDLVRAKELGINVSQVCRNAVKEAIRRMEGSFPSRDPGIYRKPYLEHPKKIKLSGDYSSEHVSRGCDLDWSRIEAFQASNPGSNPGSRTNDRLFLGLSSQN